MRMNWTEYLEHVVTFVAEQCESGPTYSTVAKKLALAFYEWCKTKYIVPVQDDIRFYHALTKIGITKSGRTLAGIRCRHSIQLSS